MPPITRNQTKSLPKAVQNTSTETPPTSSSTAIPRSPHRKSRPTCHSQPQTRTAEVIENLPLSPPRFTIDLSLPPSRRYAEVCATLRDEMLGVQSLFDEVVGGFLPWLPSVILNWMAWALLWRVCDAEEDAELDGISKTLNIPKYLLVAFNVFLDLLMGCSSGGAAVRENTGSESSAFKMVHFRTLDWDMPSLRRVVVILDFVLEPQGEVVASSITYAGFVGVLTGVRRDLSLSLNFRAVREGSGSWTADLRYYGHLVLVLLGARQSISSILRGYLLPRDASASRGGMAMPLPSYAEIVKEFSCSDRRLLSTACYLFFSSGRETTVIEKDLMTARKRSSSEFIVVTNGEALEDAADTAAKEKSATSPSAKKSKTTRGASPPPASALEELIEDANERKACAEKTYRSQLRRRAKELRQIHGSGLQGQVGSSALLSTVNDIVEVVQKYPTTNECTHFAAVLDPLDGKIAWCRYWREPIDMF